MKKYLAGLTVVAAVLVGPAAGLAGAADEPPKQPVVPQRVIDSVLGAVDQKLDEAVAADELDAERAATIKERLHRRIANLRDGIADRSPRAKARGATRRHLRRAALLVSAKAIDVPPRELARSLRDGKSVADVARANDVEPATVIDAVVAAGSKRIDRAVANEKIDAKRAATAKERLPERATTFVNATRRARPAG
jgi:hypothetical protein